MADRITIQLTEVVGSTLCVASEDGIKVFTQIVDAINNRRKVRLSFLNVESLTSAFLNAAIGQLYGQFSEEAIRTSMSVSDIEQDDLILLKRVIDTAKLYFKSPDQFAAARQEIFEDEPEK
ncbi:MAG TPA: STAS-like domain-containing protein [Anaerolineaceae bacterium]|jgi:hypothetical protein|nr:STAS-like domain-containing protein [Anaerolineaceae bacterium]